MLHAMKQKALSVVVADPLRNSPRDSPAISLSGKARGGKDSPFRPRLGLSHGLPEVRGGRSGSLLHHESFPPGKGVSRSLSLPPPRSLSLAQASCAIGKAVLWTEQESTKSELGAPGAGPGFRRAVWRGCFGPAAALRALRSRCS